MKPGTPALRSTRLLDQVQERVRYFHYSLSTEKAYPVLGTLFHPLAWPRRRYAASARHGAPEVEALLTMLATERRVSASTHNQGPQRVAVSISGSAGHRFTLAGWREPPSAKAPHSQCADQGGSGRAVPVSQLGYGDVSTTMIYTHVLKVAAGGTVSPLDTMGFGA